MSVQNLVILDQRVFFRYLSRSLLFATMNDERTNVDNRHRVSHKSQTPLRCVAKKEALKDAVKSSL